MTNWTLEPGINLITSEVASNSAPRTVSWSVANTKGAWTQITSSTAHPFTSILIGIRGGDKDTSTAGPVIVDIGIGSSGVEKVLVPNIWVSENRGNIPLLPINISVPAGSRISARAQGSASSGNAAVFFLGLVGSYEQVPFGQIESFGADVSDSSGTVIDPGVTQNTMGSWVELGTSTFQYGQLIISSGRTVQNGSGSLSTKLEIGIGSSTFEKTILEDYYISDQSSQKGGCTLLTLPVTIPNGTRIAARCQSQNTTSPGREIEVSILGVG